MTSTDASVALIKEAKRRSEKSSVWMMHHFPLTSFIAVVDAHKRLSAKRLPHPPFLNEKTRFAGACRNKGIEEAHGD